MWVSEINSKSCVFTHYLSASRLPEPFRNFQRSPLTANNQMSGEALAPRRALADLRDLRYANDTISLRGRDCMQMLLTAFAPPRTGPRTKTTLWACYEYASFDPLWVT